LPVVEVDVDSPFNEKLSRLYSYTIALGAEGGFVDVKQVANAFGAARSKRTKEVLKVGGDPSAHPTHRAPCADCCFAFGSGRPLGKEEASALCMYAKRGGDLWRNTAFIALGMLCGRLLIAPDVVERFS
jgi:hypothetical protein